MAEQEVHSNNTTTDPNARNHSNYFDFNFDFNLFGADSPFAFENNIYEYAITFFTTLLPVLFLSTSTTFFTYSFVVSGELEITTLAISILSAFFSYFCGYLLQQREIHQLI